MGDILHFNNDRQERELSRQAAQETFSHEQAKGTGLRKLFDIMCRACNQTWTAPAVGACPQCSDRRVRLLGTRYCDAPYRP